MSTLYQGIKAYNSIPGSPAGNAPPTAPGAPRPRPRRPGTNSRGDYKEPEGTGIPTGNLPTGELLPGGESTLGDKRSYMPRQNLMDQFIKYMLGANVASPRRF